MPPKRRRQSTTAPAPKRTRHNYSGLSSRSLRRDCIKVDTTPRKSAATSSFLALPRELRDQIYHETWRTKPPFEVALPQTQKGDHKNEAVNYGFRGDYFVFQILYENTEKPPPQPAPKKRSATSGKKQIKIPASSWILASKQVLDEAMEQFNRQATWSYICSSYGQRSRQLAAWRPPVAKRRTTTRRSPMLLTMNEACAINVNNVPNLLTIYVHGEMDDAEKPLSRVQFDNSTIKLLKAISSGIAGSQNLKRLSLVLKANAWRGGASDHPIKVNLQVLDSFNAPNLQTLQIAVQFNDPFRGDDRLMEELRPYVAHLGKAMVGGDGYKTGRFKNVKEQQLEWQFVFTRR